tara:strand:- start:786 stop:1619 length:834 start_codon:yes stop_codon:yes gene_type:complete
MINNKIKLEEFAKNLNQDYLRGYPYPHIVIDNLFENKILDKILTEFNTNSENNVIFNNPNEKKITLNKWQGFGSNCSSFLKFLNNKVFIKFLEDLTEIKELFADDLLEGGGLHEIRKGGFLKIHADFNKHSQTNFDRRINVLIYLNKNWQSEWGGDFEMWSKDLKKCVKKIEPIFNRTVIFSTTSTSFHGHQEPLKTPDFISRKSIAMYYYTNGRPKHEIQQGLKYHSTLFKNTGDSIKNRNMIFYNFKKRLKPKNIIKFLLPQKIHDQIIDKKRNK